MSGKILYVIALAVFVLGLGLLIISAAYGEEVTLLGVTFHSRIAKGVGIICTIMGLMTALAAYGSAPPPR
jgi:hypothetical protein